MKHFYTIHYYENFVLLVLNAKTRASRMQNIAIEERRGMGRGSCL